MAKWQEHRAESEGLDLTVRKPAATPPSLTAGRVRAGTSVSAFGRRPRLCI